MENTFTPNGTMTRGIFVTVLGRFAGVAADQGIVQGVSPTQFAPESSVTREQMTKMVHT